MTTDRIAEEPMRHTQPGSKPFRVSLWSGVAKEAVFVRAFATHAEAKDYASAICSKRSPAFVYYGTRQAYRAAHDQPEVSK